MTTSSGGAAGSSAARAASSFKTSLVPPLRIEHMTHLIASHERTPIDEQQCVIWSQYLDEFCCVRDCHKGVGLAATSGDAPDGSSASIGDSPHISVSWTQFFDPRSCFPFAVTGIRCSGSVW